MKDITLIEDITLKVGDVLNLQVQLYGTDQQGRYLKGFLAQTLSEGIKREARSFGKKLHEKADDFRGAVTSLAKEYGFEGVSEQELGTLLADKNPQALEYEDKVKELLQKEVTITEVEKIPFALIKDKEFDTVFDFELLYSTFFTK